MPLAFGEYYRQEYDSRMTKKALDPARKAECDKLKAIFNSKKHDLGLTQEKLAHALDMNQSSVSHYMNGVNPLNAAAASAFARILGVDVFEFSPRLAREIADMAGGVGRAAHAAVESNVEPALGPIRYFEYPEISWVQAGVAMEALELPNIGACEAHPSDAWAGPNGFWLKVRGPSMTSHGGVSFSEGMVILVAPGFDVESGQYVVAKMIDTNEATFKQFIRDSGRAFLKPLNPAFPTIEMDDTWTIVGRVVDAKWPRSVL